ncbi:MAG: NfeD family protein [Candidatus Ornithospirochaeta sp.]
MHWLIWLSLGIVLSILELFVPGVFLVGIGSAMAVTSIVAAFSLPLWLQLLTFGVCIVLFFVFIRPLVDKIPSNARKSGTDALMGKTGVVVGAISPHDDGRVKVNGEEWKAKSDDTLEEGREVVICDIEGVTLKVRRK